MRVFLSLIFAVIFFVSGQLLVFARGGRLENRDETNSGTGTGDGDGNEEVDSQPRKQPRALESE